MSNINTESLSFLEPWVHISYNNTSFEDELHKEISEKHVLYRLKVKAIAKRIDCDDVLFLINKNEYAVVHLTWKSKSENNPEWPITTIYKHYEDWKQHCMVPNYIEYSSSLQVFKVEKANKRLGDEIALHGNISVPIKPGDYLSLENDWNKNFKVKGIEHISFIDKSKLDLNPWIIIDTNFQPKDFIGKKLIIVKLNK